MSNVTSYPLSWPIGHTRAKFREDSRFGTNSWSSQKRTTLAGCLDALQAELDRLGARDVVLSTNLQLRLDGLPKSGQAMPADPGVAVYFKLKGKQIVLPCDKWRKVECNLMAIVKHIEALRGLERWGVGTVERAFSGYAALPEKAVSPAWYDVLCVTSSATAEEIKKAFWDLAKVGHPDVGGDPEKWHQINEAKEIGLKQQR